MGLKVSWSPIKVKKGLFFKFFLYKILREGLKKRSDFYHFWLWPPPPPLIKSDNQFFWQLDQFLSTFGKVYFLL